MGLAFSSTKQQIVKLTEEQRRIYAAEEHENFRWISKIIASYSSYTLTAADRAPISLYHTLSDIGEHFTCIFYFRVTTPIYLTFGINFHRKDNSQNSLSVQFHLKHYSNTSHY